MSHEHLGWCFVAQAFAGLVVQMTCELDQVALRDNCQICIAWHEAANAFVGVFHGPLLPRCTRVAEPAACADPFFQSPESGKLGTTIKREALTREGRQGRESSDDLVHDRARMPAWILDENGGPIDGLGDVRPAGLEEGRVPCAAIIAKFVRCSGRQQLAPFALGVDDFDRLSGGPRIWPSLHAIALRAYEMVVGDAASPKYRPNLTEPDLDS